MDTEIQQYTREQFTEHKWSAGKEENKSSSTVAHSLRRFADLEHEADENTRTGIFKLLSDVMYLRFSPDSANAPYGQITFLPTELNFFADIVNVIDNLWIKARLADVLWLSPKTKKIDYARLAISIFIKHPITQDSWHQGEKDCCERAARLCLQIKDTETLNNIKQKLFEQLKAEYPSNDFMALHIARLMDKLSIDRENLESIADILRDNGKSHSAGEVFTAAIIYFEFAAKKYRQAGDTKNSLDCLLSAAMASEAEADKTLADRGFIANSFYNDTLQKYRRIPVEHRDEFGVNEKIHSIRVKMTETGRSAMSNMASFQIPYEGTEDIARLSVEHVSGKNSSATALLYFAGIRSAIKYDELKNRASNTMKSMPISSLFYTQIVGRDGETLANIPALDLRSDNEDTNSKILHFHMMRSIQHDISLITQGIIIPALERMINEYTFPKDLLVEACLQSPIVPDGREELLGYALWLGFELEFSHAIHLICPQVEHMVRVLLQQEGCHTSTVNSENIVMELGLSSLLTDEFAILNTIIGKDEVFELKSLFADVQGANLRNEVAHGLLDDSSGRSVNSIYAWWMILRLVIGAIPFSETASHHPNAE
jgi:hypothetical protein